MKKSLSILLALALVLTMFSGLAFAADSAAGTELKGYGIIKGSATGDLMESSNWKRQDVVVILARLFGKESLAASYSNTHGFTDVEDPYYNGFISWAKDQKYFNGRDSSLFGFNDDISYQEFIAVLIRALGYVGDKEVPYANVPAKSIELGLVPENTVMSATANRGLYFNILTKILNTKNTEGVILGTALKLSGFKEKALSVTSVKATTTKVDHLLSGQLLTFAINGEIKNTAVKTLTDAGYTVEFSISNKKFLSNSATGELDTINIFDQSTFDYNVKVSKDGKDIVSPNVSAKAIDFSTTGYKILSYKLFYNTDVELLDKTLSRGEDVKLDSIKVEMLNGATKTYESTSTTDNLTNLNFSTSNAERLIVNPDGTINPITSGSVTIKIKKDDASLDIPVTISSETRKPTKITSSLSSMKVVNSIEKDITLVVYDQFNNPLKGFEVISAAAGTLPISIKKTSTTTEIATINPTTSGTGVSDKDGKVKLKLIANATSTGTGVFEVKHDTKLLNSISIDIGKSGNETFVRKLELANPSLETKLDIKRGSTTRMLDMYFNKYDKDNYFQGFETTDLSNLTTDLKKYVVESSDVKIATVSVNNGLITVEGVKKGTVTIRVLEGTITRSSISITVVDSSPVITAINFETDYEQTTAAKIDLAKVLKTSGIVLDQSNVAVNFSDTGDIYVEVIGSGYSATDDITLGKIYLYSYVRNENNPVKVTYDPGYISKNTSSTTTATPGPFAAGDKGQIVVGIAKNNDTYPSFTKTVNVNIP